MPTALGAGVAVPNCYDPTVVRSRCFLGLAPGGLDDRGPDGEPMRLVFVLISPAGHAREHLAGLAALAQVAADGPFVQQLAKQTTSARLLGVMRRRE
jgi:mannitol/fructose-specific phosphotransferase system IIA component (Ntr-type)